MAFLRKIKAGLVKSDFDTFVGEEGNIFFNVETGEFRLSDGQTEGGIGIGGGGGGGGNYVLPTASTTVKGGVKIDGTTIKINNQVISGFSGSYNDLTNKPSIPTKTSQLTNDSSFVTNDGLTWSAISGKPTFATVATTGSYHDLLSKPTLSTVATTGSYNDLLNKPTIPSAYTLPTASNSVLGGIKVGSGLSIDGSGVLSATGGGGSPLAVSLIDTANTVSGTISNVTALRFDTDSGFDITDLGGGAVKVGMNSTFKTWKVDGQQDLVATGLDTIRFEAGPGMIIETNPAGNPKSIKFTSTAAASTTAPIKTFNILNDFSAPLLGKAIFVPNSSDTIRSIQLTNGQPVSSDLMVGLYRNDTLLSFFTIPAGKISYKYSGLDYPINPNDYLTVSVVAGFGSNFSMGLYNIDA